MLRCHRQTVSVPTWRRKFWKMNLYQVWMLVALKSGGRCGCVSTTLLLRRDSWGMANSNLMNIVGAADTIIVGVPSSIAILTWEAKKVAPFSSSCLTKRAGNDIIQDGSHKSQSLRAGTAAILSWSSWLPFAVRAVRTFIFSRRYQSPDRAAENPPATTAGLPPSPSLPAFLPASSSHPKPFGFGLLWTQIAAPRHTPISLVNIRNCNSKAPFADHGQA